MSIVEKVGVWVVCLLVLGLVQKFITNPIAQKHYPTYEHEGEWKKYKYHLVHVLVMWGYVLLPIGLIIVGYAFLTGNW